MEADGYRFGASVIPACSVGADHIRERIWFSAYTDVRAEHVGTIHAETQMLSWRDRIAGGVLPPHGVSAGVDKRRACKGFGNAIVPQLAAEVIASYMECRP
jgi:site-specific DNA-cytosine methylase